MKRHGSDRDPELEAFLAPCKIQRQMPAELRSRVIARARATLAGDVVPPARPLPAGEPLALRFARGRRAVRIAFVAAVAVVAATVGALAALHGRSARSPEVPAPPGAAPALTAPATPSKALSNEPVPADAERERPIKRSRPAHPGAKGDPFGAELELLQRAHAAYTRRDFSAALELVADHARRFPAGHLAEQREALRVRSLGGAGRADEAHRAAAAFAIRFPRSVLLPRVAESAESPVR